MPQICVEVELVAEENYFMACDWFSDKLCPPNYSLFSHNDSHAMPNTGRSQQKLSTLLRNSFHNVNCKQMNLPFPTFFLQKIVIKKSGYLGLYICLNQESKSPDINKALKIHGCHPQTCKAIML